MHFEGVFVRQQLIPRAYRVLSCWMQRPCQHRFSTLGVYREQLCRPEPPSPSSGFVRASHYEFGMTILHIDDIGHACPAQRSCLFVYQYCFAAHSLSPRDMEPGRTASKHCYLVAHCRFLFSS